MSKEVTFDRFVRSIGILLVFVAIYFLLRRLSSVLIPFLVAWIAAYLLYPIVCFFQYKCRLKYRILAIIATIITLLAVLVLLGKLVVPSVVEECHNLHTVVVNYVENSKHHSDLSKFINEYVRPYLDIDNLSKYFNMEDLTQFLRERVPQLFSLVSSSIGAILSFIASLVSILYMFFILLDYEKLNDGFIKMVPQRHRTFVAGMLRDVKRGMNSYFRGQSLIALCVGILFSIGFLIIDFPLAIPLGLFIGLLNLVPYLQILGLIPTIILALLQAHDTGDSFWTIIGLALLVFLVVQAIQDMILTPKIMGNAMGMNAAVMLLSLSIWGSLLGFVGLIIALPLTTLLLSYYKRYVLKESDIIHN